MINLIIFITKNEIFAYDMSDMTAPVQIGFEGNESVQLSEPEAIESCCSCITERYNVDDISEDDFDFVIIDCNAKKKFIADFAKKVQACRKMSVYPLEKLIVPALINSSRVPENTVYVSYGEFTYKVFSSEGVYCTEKVKRDDADIKLTEADFSFVFNYNELSSQSTSSAAPVEDTARITELNAEIERLNQIVIQSEQNVSELQNQLVESNNSNRNNNEPDFELKEKLRAFMNNGLSEDDPVFPIDDYDFFSDRGDDGIFKVIIVNNKTDYWIGLPIDESSGEEHILKTLKSAVIGLNEQSKLSVSPYAALSIGDTFEFGRYKDKPIIWRVLDKENGILKVVSEDIICERPFDSNFSVSFDNSELRKWLNGVFLRSSFSESEKLYIRNRYISLLSKENVKLLFDDIESRITKSKKEYYLCDAKIESVARSIYSSTQSLILYSVNGKGEVIDIKLNLPVNTLPTKGVRPYFELIYDADKATMHEKVVSADDLEVLGVDEVDIER